MKKFCIFCGKKPASKNKEHVIPRWLIKMTGDPGREIFLGLKWTSPDLERRQFSFNSFTLPSCKECNSACSELEAEAKAIVVKVMNSEPLAASDIDLFLDWLDKVRIGLWLAMIYLNENHRGLIPQFHINDRIGSKDRLLIIYEIQDDGDTGVGWAGTDSPLFQCIPSCFTLTINNFLFFNASHDFLLSQRLGFPYASVRKHRPEGGEWIEMASGTEEIRFPLLQKRFKSGGTQLFQPMIPFNHFRNEDGSTAEFSNIYDTDYVKAHCMNHSEGRGLIFRRQQNELVQYPSGLSKDWIPIQTFPRGELYHQTGALIGDLLEDLYRHGPSFEDLPLDLKAERESEVAGALRLHNVMMNHFNSQKDLYTGAKPGTFHR